MEILVAQKIQPQLTLSPSLRLSLLVLQMPLLELHSFLEQQLQENPLLEPQESAESERPEPELPSEKDRSDGLEPEFEELWGQAGAFLPAHREEETLPANERVARLACLEDHLLQQLRIISPLEEPIRRVATLLIGWLDKDGYLRDSPEEIALQIGVETPQVEEALEWIQRLDPPGIGARNLPECLAIQLNRRQPVDRLALVVVTEYFDLLAKRKLSRIATRLGVELSEIQRACRGIARLEPKPARGFSVERAPALIPDLIVREMKEGQYDVELNDEDLPRLGLSSAYVGLLRDPATAPEAKRFIREKIRQGIWLLRAVSQRNTTLLSIARWIVQLEQEYLSEGILRLKPLTQDQVARRVGCHPSTISRAIDGKTIQTPYGILPLDRFFGGGIVHPTEEGKRISSQTVQAEIQALIAQEDSTQPFSDQALMKILQERGFPVARRTVAKYRDQLRILPARLRGAGAAGEQLRGGKGGLDQLHQLAKDLDILGGKPAQGVARPEIQDP